MPMPPFWFILHRNVIFIYHPLYFSDVANSTVKFDEKGDGLGRYTIYNYQKTKDNETDYKIVGKWFNGLNLNISNIMWSLPEEVPDPETSFSKNATLEPKSNTSRIILSDVDGVGIREEGGQVFNDLYVSDSQELTMDNLFDNEPTLKVKDGLLKVKKNTIPTSVCSSPCDTGEIMIMTSEVCLFWNFPCLDDLW